MKRVKIFLFIFLSLIILHCNKQKNDVIMPNFLTFGTGGIADHPERIKRVKLTISSQFKAKGKNAIKSALSFEATDLQIDSAEIASAILFPSTFVLEMPPVGTQGAEGSCSAFATEYYARSRNWYTKTGASSYATTANIFSPEYVFDQIKSGGCTGGSSLISNLEFLKNNGDVLWNTLPYDDLQCDITPTTDQINEAKLYKIGAYSQIISSDIQAIKSVVYNGNAAIFQFSPDEIWRDGDGTANFIWKVRGTAYSLHANCIVGWDDSKNAWLTINQYGTAWGDAGYRWIDYDFFSTVASAILYISESAPPSNTAPTANAGFDHTVSVGTMATLDGSASFDPDGTIVGWAWTQISGPASPSINGSSSTVATVTPTVAGTYVFKLTVTDNLSLTASDTVTITAVSQSVDTCSLSVSKTVFKGKTTDILSWSITTAEYPLDAYLLVSTNGVDFALLYDIQPYSPQGTFSYRPANAKKIRYYKLAVVKSNRVTIYSSVVSIK